MKGAILKMITAYKGFNYDFTCTRGKGVFQYEIGKTYTEDEKAIGTRKKGFHATIEPLKVLDWYSDTNARFAMVELSGHMNDEAPDIICASQIKIIKELTKKDLLKEEIKYFLKNKTGILNDTPYYAMENIYITTKPNITLSAKHIGDKLIFIEDNNISVLIVDGDKIKPHKKYNSKGLEN